MEKPTADVTTLMNQAPMTVEVYLARAIAGIDRAYNTTGYAKDHPELVGAFLQACAVDFASSVLLGALKDIEESIGLLAQASS